LKKITPPYVPDLGFKYPDKADAHVLQVDTIVDVVVDENYPFLDKSLKFKFQSALLYLGIFVLVFFVQPIRYGLKIEGKHILRKYKHLFKNGAMTVSNHVLRWDFLCVLQAIKYRRLYFPLWAANLTGSDRNLVRWAGGIPVPEGIHAIKNFNAAFDELHEKKKWIHVFPESSRWDYFQPIRPFKKGVFSMAYKYDLPIIPMAFSYRESKGLYKLFKGKYPLITLRIGEPILPDLEMSRKEAVKVLREETHRKIVELAGITNNPYPCEGD
jgi:1-acyl-sn-glycerol-3-phosphate acyltransferase